MGKLLYRIKPLEWTRATDLLPRSNYFHAKVLGGTYIVQQVQKTLGIWEPWTFRFTPYCDDCGKTISGHGLSFEQSVKRCNKHWLRKLQPFVHRTTKRQTDK